MSTPATDARFMALALALGRRGMGRTWPNPAVGCVIVQEGIVVGRGWTADGGRPHAEPRALAQAGARARGATAYVTLEPCAHHGQTPPCAEALIAAGVARVVVATTDPDPRVAGRGLALLRDSGVALTTGVMQAEADADHAGFFSRIRAGRPLVTLKLATTLDGRIATRTGDSRWITGPLARRHVHALRLRHDAVMVGAGTVRADDPMLDVRGFGPVRHPVRVVLSAALDLPRAGRLWDSAGAPPLWLCHGPEAEAGAWTGQGALSLPVPLTDGALDLPATLATLGAQGLTRVLCEGGGTLAAGLLRAGLVDRLVLFTGGAAIGADGRAGLGPMGVSALADAPRFTLAQVTPVGGDVMQVWHPTA